MDTGKLTAEQRAELLKELGRHYVVDTPPFEKCACGDSMASAGHDLDTHRLEVAFLFGIAVAKRPKPRRKVVPASEVKVGHEIMSARRRILVTQVQHWTTPEGVAFVQIAGTYKPKPSSVHRVSTGFQRRVSDDVTVMNWLPPAA